MAVHSAGRLVAPLVILLVDPSVDRSVAASAGNSADHLAASKEASSGKNLVACWVELLGKNSVDY